MFTPWRIPILYRTWRETVLITYSSMLTSKESISLRRKLLAIQTVEGLFDLCFIFLSLPILLTGYRIFSLFSALVITVTVNQKKKQLNSFSVKILVLLKEGKL